MIHSIYTSLKKYKRSYQVKNPTIKLDRSHEENDLDLTLMYDYFYLVKSFWKIGIQRGDFVKQKSFNIAK